MAVAKNLKRIVSDCGRALMASLTLPRISFTQVIPQSLPRSLAQNIERDYPIEDALDP
jgi:hypothetical protein